MAKDRFLDHFKVGEIFLTEGITITESEIIRFAMQYDPQSFHLDVTAALKSPYKDLIEKWVSRLVSMLPNVYPKGSYFRL